MHSDPFSDLVPTGARSGGGELGDQARLIVASSVEPVLAQLMEATRTVGRVPVGVSSGAEVLAALERHPGTTVVAACDLPDLDPFALAIAAGDRDGSCCALPVLVVCHDVTAEMEMLADALGLPAIVSVPVKAQALADRVAAVERVRGAA